VREGVPPVAPLSLCAALNGKLFGGIRFTAIRIGAERNAALLGPLVVDPAEKGKGIGRALVQEGLMRARAEGFALVLLVGDMPYYGRFGFQPVPFGQITLPGPVDPARLLAVELVPGTLAGAAGQVKAYARQWPSRNQVAASSPSRRPRARKPVNSGNRRTPLT
jgi:predicted N-acetyltransferase YhbS